MVNDGLRSIGKLETCLFHPDAESCLAVTDPDTGGIFGIEPATEKEHIPLHRLMTAIHKIIAGNDNIIFGLIGLCKAEIAIREISRHPFGRWRIKLPNDPARGRPDLLIKKGVLRHRS